MKPSQSDAFFINNSFLGEFENINLLTGNRYSYIYVKNELGGEFKRDSLYLPAQDTLYNEIRF